MKPLVSGPPQVSGHPLLADTKPGPEINVFYLYNELLLSGHLYKADADTKINYVWLISIVNNLY